jgi:HlyD family secretion protein
MTQQERKQSVRLWFWRVSAVLLVIVFFVVRSFTRDRLEIHAFPAAHQPLSSTISTNGRVEPEENFELHSPIATTVKAVYVQPGDEVPAGKLLMVLDDTLARARMASAESGVKAAQAALEAATHNGNQQERQIAAADETRARLERDEARRSLEMLTKLKATGAASASEVAAAQERLDAAEASLHASNQGVSNRYSPAEVERARAAVTDAQANLTEARQVVAQSEVHAPVAGTVYSIDAKATEFVDQGKLLLQIADLHRERVRAYFDEPEIGKLALGQSIQIKWDARQGRVWNGHIERTPVTVINLGTRSVGEVLVKIDNLDSELLPETNVNVTATTSSETNALTIPREALRSEDGKTYVFKLVGDVLQRVPVTTGTLNLTQVAILSGLAEGDQVATGSVSGLPLREGVPVKVVR